MQRIRWLAVLRLVALLAVVFLLLALPSSGYPPSRQSTLVPSLAPTMSRVWWSILAIQLIAHGIAHLSGVFACFGRRNAGFAERPCVFSGRITLHTPIGRAFSLVWLAASVTLVGSGLGLLLGQDWWTGLAVAAAALSLLAILSWWNAVPPGAKVGAAFDLLILVAAVQPR